jgi:hypothetical protein
MRRTTIVTGTALVLALGLLAPVGSTATAAPSAKRTFDKAPTCDFDGDGYGDLLQVAMPQDENVGSIPGRLTTIEGSARGVRGSDRTVFENLRYGESPRWEGADFNRDGYTDVVDNYRIVPGSPTGLDYSNATTLPANVGFPVVPGLFDDDEWPDLATAFRTDVDDDNANDILGARFFYGGPNGFTSEASSTVTAPDARVYFGSELVPADLDGDGHTDLVESSTTYDDFQVEKAMWIRGTADGPQEIREIDGHGVPHVGDVTGDGRDDLVLSRPWQRNGRFTFFRGSAAGPVKVGVVSQATPGVPGRGAKNPGRDADGDSVPDSDRFQASSLTDVTGDGRADVIVSVPGKDVKGKRDVGRIIVLKGTAKGIARKGNVVLKPVTAKLRAGRHLSLNGAAQLDGRGRPELVVEMSGKRPETERYRVLTLAKGKKVRVTRSDLLPRTDLDRFDVAVMNCTR